MKDFNAFDLRFGFSMPTSFENRGKTIKKLEKPRKKQYFYLFFAIFEVWVKDFNVFDLRFGFSTPKSFENQ